MRTPGANAEETGRRVRDAAVRLFARQGFAATGIRELAQEAGITTAALYHYMGTKDDLLVDIMRSCLEPLLVTGGGLAGDDGTASSRLAALVEFHVYFHAARSLPAAVADSELRALGGERLAEIVRMRDAYEGIWTRLVEEGVETGEFDVSDARVATIALLQLCTGVAHWYRPGGRLALPELCHQHADLVLGMVRAQRDGQLIRRAELELPDPALQLELAARA